MSVADDLAQLAAEAPGVISQAVAVIKKVKPVLPTVKLVVEDPAFPQVIQRIQTLAAIEAAKPSSGGGGSGIGLAQAVPFLDAVIYARKNPWAPWAVGGGLLLLIGGIGYRMGKRSK